ncbi:uroporphyrinogen-III C-methyltransferase [Bacillus daqingensis]|uniref:uroporphyrinogen-III C-methyltransferase n=1 Tax=Bacillus daqingensis TaxID=872396 RepID=A0ABV9NYI3_9BACI
MYPVKLTGAGPGDPDLITVKGLRAIQEADVIYYDRLVSRELLKEASPHAALVYCGKKPGGYAVSQEDINAMLIRSALSGKRVTRLKGGDPFIFGRGGEEAIALKEAGLSFEVIPGVTSGAAVPASAGIPVTHRHVSSSVGIIAGVTKLDDDAYWHHTANSMDTLCIYMGGGNIRLICEKLIQAGKPADMPAAVISNGTTADEVVVTAPLHAIAEEAAGAPQPAMIVIGEVVGLMSRLNGSLREEVVS